MAGPEDGSQLFGNIKLANRTVSIRLPGSYRGEKNTRAERKGMRKDAGAVPTSRDDRDEYCSRSILTVTIVAINEVQTRNCLSMIFHL